MLTVSEAGVIHDSVSRIREAALAGDSRRVDELAVKIAADLIPLTDYSEQVAS